MKPTEILTRILKQAATASQTIPLAPKGTEAAAIGMNASPSGQMFAHMMASRKPAQPAPALAQTLPAAAKPKPMPAITPPAVTNPLTGK